MHAETKRVLLQRRVLNIQSDKDGKSSSFQLPFRYDARGFRLKKKEIKK